MVICKFFSIHLLENCDLDAGSSWKISSCVQTPYAQENMKPKCLHFFLNLEKIFIGNTQRSQKLSSGLLCQMPSCLALEWAVTLCRRDAFWDQNAIPYRLPGSSEVKLLNITNPNRFESVSSKKLCIKNKYCSLNCLSPWKDFGGVVLQMGRVVVHSSAVEPMSVCMSHSN